MEAFFVVGIHEQGMQEVTTLHRFLEVINLSTSATLLSSLSPLLFLSSSTFDSSQHSMALSSSLYLGGAQSPDNNT